MHRRLGCREWIVALGGALLATAPWLFLIAAVTTVASHLLLPRDAAKWSLLIGGGGALAFWVAVSLLGRRMASVEAANPTSYGELRQRVMLIRARYDAQCAYQPVDLALSDSVSPAPSGNVETQHGRAAAYAAAMRRLVVGLRDLLARRSSASIPAGRSAACGQLAALLCLAESELGLRGGTPAAGPRYVLGAGYIDLWRAVHTMEELLMEIEPIEEIGRWALHNRLRLLESTIPNKEELLSHLNAAARELSPAMTEYLPPSPIAKPVTSGERRETQRAKLPEGAARALLAAVAHAINEFRDDRWAGLVQARNRLLATRILTGQIAFLLLALAIAIDAHPKHVVAVAAFYLVGAVIGLFNQLRIDAQTESAVHDYGLAAARLSHTPLISGLAAVAGVVLTAMLVSPPIGVAIGPQQPDATPVATATAGVDAGQETPAASPEAAPREDSVTSAMRPPSLSQIVDLETYPFGLVVAAVFGLTPGLVIDRLRSQEERLKDDLAKSEAAGGGAGVG